MVENLGDTFEAENVDPNKGYIFLEQLRKVGDSSNSDNATK